MGFMGHHYDGLAGVVKIFQQFHDLPAGLAIKIPCGLVRQNQIRVGGQGPGNGSPDVNDTSPRDAGALG